MPAALSENDQYLADQLLAIGCPKIVPLRTVKAESPDQIPYLDLLSRDVRQTAKRLPDAVAEYQGRPVLYIIDAKWGEPEEVDRIELQHRLASRGDHGVLAVVRPGELLLYPLNLDRRQLNTQGLPVSMDDAEAPFLFESLATGFKSLSGTAKEADPVFEEIRKLLKRAIQDLVVEAGVDGLTVLSMTGRALFFRFLIDRKIVDDSLLSKICPSIKKGPGPHDLRAVFSTPERAAHASKWLDETFNGDLLPLCDTVGPSTTPITRLKAYKEIYASAGKQCNGELFHHLEAILRGWKHLKGATQMTLPIDWDDLHFRHIPVGVLSQVYENFSHQVDEKDSSDRSVHYTPRLLAGLLVEQSLAGLDVPAHEARVLDPACGAGVFLVLALRELVRRQWQADLERLKDKARRPSKAVIERILYRQIRGFDISESALRLAALGLYITVIELNEITTPPSAHHASKALRNLVLFDQRTEEERQLKGFVNGSLGEAVDRKKFDGTFDVVVGNPPWSRTEGEAKTALDTTANQIARRVLMSRGLSEISAGYANPGGLPDLPFFWRAMEWAKPGGIIGFALDARLILSQSNVGTKARNALFQAVSVTGILNGSDLEETPVWSKMKMPWILVWARNHKPNLDHHFFHLLTPIRENELSNRGRFRLDYQSAYQISVKQVIHTGWLCKALAMGSTLDVSVMEKMTKAAKKQSIGSFWAEGKAAGLMSSGRGIDLQPWKKNQAPEWLLKLPVADFAIESNDESSLFDCQSIPTFQDAFGDREPHTKYGKENYQKPLLLLPEAPGQEIERRISHRWIKEDACYTRSYYGYSAGAHQDADLIINILHLIVNSHLFRHFCYMRSSRIGASRRTLYKHDIDAFPFPRLEDLDSTARTRISELAELLDTGGLTDWSALETQVSELFDLTKDEQQVVADTVNFNGPYRIVRQAAAQPVPPDECVIFAKTLEHALQPFFKAVGQKVKAHVEPRIDKLQAWEFVTLVLEGDSWAASPKLLADLMSKASYTTATRVIMPLPEGGLIMGLVNKRRFWTASRARLSALYIASEHMEKCFPLPRK
ncbi:MAG: N-6 DNA methylase [Luteolibacter sp.]